MEIDVKKFLHTAEPDGHMLTYDDNAGLLAPWNEPAIVFVDKKCFAAFTDGYNSFCREIHGVGKGGYIEAKIFEITLIGIGEIEAKIFEITLIGIGEIEDRSLSAGIEDTV